MRHVADQLQITAARKPHAFAAQHGTTHAVIATYVAPDLAQIGMALVTGGGQFAVAGFHLDIEHAVMRTATRDVQALVNAVVNRFHGKCCVEWVDADCALAAVDSGFVDKYQCCMTEAVARCA